MIENAGSTLAMDDHVILVDADGTPRGLAPRATVHSTRTPLHLAFSCHVVRADGAVLLTRRALSKRTWPGVWTNSFCGHPRQGESFIEAIDRHARHELGIAVRPPLRALPDFRYRAVDASGVVENEVCPVFVAELADAAADAVGRTGAAGPASRLSPNPEEVMDHRWVAPEELRALVELAPWALSPWAVEQIPQLDAHLLRSAAGAR
ncbi:isopentenyl-diphosphate delta-isomerase [Brachybacterium ginsengisoli]|uniref:Isopentenyl-diphosphate Delta-isomerase n=1 Tax=Brachybacterium ginsengisoli TaxID=1331682 RepID=A0A291H0K2_9MICO|nr:isopentenyl-diphosphate Delta-isomerase [Brachybacterium ginsengisoli]ATG55922.1 isopentenyl-diphosphate delta-isomerase [Brachybacterium ginsengisoli]